MSTHAIPGRTRKTSIEIAPTSDGSELIRVHRFGDAESTTKKSSKPKPKAKRKSKQKANVTPKSG